MSKVTRIAHSKNLNAGKYAQLEEIARRLGKVRAEIWRDYGSLRGVGLHYSVVAKQKAGDYAAKGVTYKLWKNTLKDVVEDIGTYRAATKGKVKKAIWKRVPRPAKGEADKCEAERIDLFSALKHDKWIGNTFLARHMRTHYRHGRTRVNNQIILEDAMYSSYEHKGRIWVKVQSLERGQRIAIPTDMDVPFTGNLRLILREGRVEIHYVRDEKDACSTKPCGDAIVGIDKGYTEVFTDSDGQRHGEGLGELLSTESDYLKTKYQKRNKLKALAKKHDKKNPAKAANIRKHNLGRKKLDKRKALHTKRVRDKVYKATHSVFDKAKTVAVADLTSPIKARPERSRRDKKKYGPDQSRRLSGWVKGTMAEALELVSKRRGSTLQLVNAAYTSQIDSTTGLLLGRREGDRFYRENGDVIDADTNAARNILARMYDNRISLYTPYREVKAILQGKSAQVKTDRTELIQDISFYGIPIVVPVINNERITEYV